MPDLADGATRLRSGVSVWQAAARSRPKVKTVNPSPGMRLSADVVIVGAGITGAFVAERMTREGRSVVVIDRREPASGSTMASTAMIQWELDASLLELEDRLGFEAAASITRENLWAVKRIGELAEECGIGCGYKEERSFLLAGDELDAADLKEEARLREKAGADSRFIDEGGLAKWKLVGSGGLLSSGAAAADPVALTLGLLSVAEARGARVLSPSVAKRYEARSDGVCVETEEGVIVEARLLVLANGYEIPDFVAAPTHNIISTWAIATKPLGRSAGIGEVVFEAADPYLYFRPGPDGCVIAGGEDVDTDDAQRRDALTEGKASAVLAKLEARRPDLRGLELDYAWAGFFGETEDSLPLIGPVPGHPNTWAAFGYGGNGISFSCIAAEMLATHLAGGRGPNAGHYAVDRTA